MAFNYFTVVTVLVLAVSAFCQDVTQQTEKEGEVLIYSENLFQENVGKTPHFVMFYAPWCGHCQRLTPIWTKLSEEINPDDAVEMTLAKVDCTKETKLCSDEGVLGYPTLKLYHPGKEPIRHTGARDIDALRKVVMGLSDPVVERKEGPLEHEDGLYDITSDSFDNHIQEGHHFIKFYAPWCGHCRRMEPTWKELAKAHIPSDQNPDDVKIGRIDCTAHGKTCSAHGVKGYPTLMWFHHGKMSQKYQGGRDTNSFETFIAKMTSTTEDQNGDEERIDATPPTEKDTKLQEEQKQQKDKEPEEEKKPTSVIEIGEDNFDFHTAVDVTFIMFFAPWCGFCKRLAPTWDELSLEPISNTHKVQVGKVDCTVHGPLCKKYEVQGYPTLLLFKDGEKIGKFSGERNKEELKKFVNKILDNLPVQEKDEL